MWVFRYKGISKAKLRPRNFMQHTCIFRMNMAHQFSGRSSLLSHLKRVTPFTTFSGVSGVACFCKYLQQCALKYFYTRWCVSVCLSVCMCVCVFQGITHYRAQANDTSNNQVTTDIFCKLGHLHLLLGEYSDGK